MKQKIILLTTFLLTTAITLTANTYEYKRDLREGARGKWVNLRKHLNSGIRLEKELVKVDNQIDKKVKEIQEIEELLFRIEQYKVENNL